MTNDFFRFQVMKRLMDRYEQSNGKKLTVDQYMIMFLKFFASVIPTIEYDFSSSI
jgi:ubiquitin-like-conjugating enzyme ATG3